MQATITRTSSGISNIDLFFSHEYIVVVEDTDDEDFWRVFFPESIDGRLIRFKPVGGRGEVNKYETEVRKGNARLIIARDSDYDVMLGRTKQHSLIVETNFHSIENVLLTPEIIHAITQIHTRRDVTISAVHEFLDAFDRDAADLLVLDYISERDNLGIARIGKSCRRYLSADTSAIFCGVKISTHVKDSGVSGRKMAANRRVVKAYKPRHYIRGHFFESSVRHFIDCQVSQLRGERIHIQADVLFSEARAKLADLIDSVEYLKELADTAKVAALAVCSA